MTQETGRLPLRTPEETTAAVTGEVSLAPFTERRAGLAVYRALAGNPDMLNAWLPLCDFFLETPGVDPRDREALILRTAHNTDSVYEWGKHADKAGAVGLSESDLSAIAGTGPADDAWLATLLAFADELHTTSTVGDRTWAAVRERLDERQALTCLMLVGQYHMLAFTLNGAAITADPA
jgi:4-carboxymuconolactone decarboxylase